MGGDGNVSLHREKREECLNLLLAHFFRVPLARPSDEESTPIHIACLRAAAVVKIADTLAKLI